jgi:hypothetical protein
VDIGGYDKFPWNPMQFHDIERETKTYRYLGAFESASFNLTGAGEPALLEGLRVSWGFFPALGVSPAIGRIFTLNEDQPGNEKEVMLSNSLWRERFGSNPNIVGNCHRPQRLAVHSGRCYAARVQLSARQRDAQCFQLPA